ncbi:HYR domain-containing protein [Flavobacterium sp. DG2-3]|uniref:HYR domain-containing protein n=1 Tax=Flavobacterium sp. DG2-3 TaxID=3068317 RepID=UPI00273FBFF9|nr:HYR domain-containing protein [Flavobacterium sp. DG2-3]MDP5202286.1 HYR domain-containing protein [Flavobacterium sp. DG2-3]
MNSFKNALENKTKVFIFFFLFAGIFVCYGQDKGIIADASLKYSIEKGVVYSNTEKSVVLKHLNSIKKSSKTLKMAADITPPSITCLPNKQLACGSLVPDYLDELIVTDDSGGDIYLTQSTGGTKFYDGMTIVFTAKDEVGNESSCSIIITALTPDVTPPTFNCPTNLTLNCGDVLPNYATNPMMNLQDDCSISVSWEMTPAPGTPFYNGIPVQIKYTDPSGNSSFCNFNVTQATPDNIPPTLTCPSNQIQNCGSFLADYRTLVTGYDNCLGNLTVSQSPLPGTIFTSGITVTLTVRDVSNNASTCSFIVNASADTSNPIITNCPGSQTLAIGDAIPDYSGLINVTDNCDLNPSIVQTPVAGTIFSAGLTVVLTANDISGNTASCTFPLIASGGDLPPVLSCPSNMQLYANSTLPNYVSYLTALSDDNTDNFDLVFTQTPPQGTLFTGDTNVTITAKDVSGNTNSCTFLVKLKSIKQDIDCKSTSINVTNLYGGNGFSIYGEILGREAGSSVKNAGDVNGDGIPDLIIGAPGNYTTNYGSSMIYKTIPGAAYVVFGKASGVSPNIDLGLLDGTNGFVIRNDTPWTNFPVTGYDVSSAGDINGDGIGDFMISDPHRSSSYGPEVGHIYVIFGTSAGFPAEFKISSLNGSNGFTFIGNENYAGMGVSIDIVGDINSDGFQDIGIVTSGSGAGNGKCYVIYGKAGGFPAILRNYELNGANGFKIEGDATVGKVGRSVSGLGDVNGDGIPDFALGSYNGSDQKRKFVIFGRSTNFSASFNVTALNGSNGFIIENSLEPLDGSTTVKKAGDLNDDGMNDLSITGRYVLFGRTSFPAIVDLKDLNGSNGFKNDTGSENLHGYAGDFNGDGIDDYFVHIFSQTCIFFGKKIWPANVSQTTDKNLKIVSDFLSEYSASYAGDLNNDGVSDFIIGNSYDSYGSNLKVNYNPGKAYVIFGKNTIDTEKPVIANCPADQKLSIGDLIPDYTKSITVTDNCDAKPVITQSPAAGSVFDGTTQEVVLKATDASGNASECKFKIELLTTGNPVIVCPTNQELYANSFLPNYVPFLEDVSDDVTPSHELTFTQTPPVGTLFTADTDVTITVKDKSGNENSCTFLVKLKTKTFDLDCNTTEIDVTELNGSNGVIIYGDKGGKKAGFTTSNAGDINGDGIQDFLIGAINEGCYVIFGTSSGFPPNINLGKLNGIDGFKIFDDAVTPPSEFAYDVSSTGDINGDGIDDLMLSDRQKRNAAKNFAGAIYVIYGKKTAFSAQFPISVIDGNNGFKILGDTKDEFLGSALVNIGDFNNDSYSDIAILSANEGSGGIKKCYVIFGRSSNFPASATIDQLITSPSFVIEGDVGQTVEASGDINGDGIADLIFSGDYTKYRYVVFGSSSLPSKINTSSLNGSNGFRIENSATALNTSQYYQFKALGDLNGDSFKDLAIDNYILFGKPSFSSTVDLKDLDGTNGFKIDAFMLDYLDFYTGYGDFNADGLDDMAVVYINNIYIVYGKKIWSPSIKIQDLNAAEALKIKIRYAANYSISYLKDINKDGIDDLLIGSTNQTYTSDPNEEPGISYLIFGSKYTDLTPPVISNCPTNQVLHSGDLIPDFTKIITVKDNCDVKPQIAQTPVAGSVFDGSDVEVLLTAVDATGNQSECKFIISSTADTTPPVITCVVDQTIACNTKVIPDFTNLIAVTDVQDPNPSLTQNPIAGSPFTDGITITITAKDISNNESSCSFKVNAFADVIAPVITCIGDQNLSCGAVIPDYTALITVTDNCDASPTLTQNPIAGSTFTDGMTITITAKDISNNESSCSFKVNASADGIAPVITCIGDQNLSCGAVIPDYTALITVTDNCDSSPILTQNPIAGSPFTDGMIITITAKDISNNESSCSFKVNASADGIAPVMTCIGDQSLSCGAVIPDYTALITVTDNCDSSPILTQNPIAGSAFTEGMTVTIIAKDISNNESSCSFKVNASADVTAPVIICIGDQNLSCGAVIPDYTALITVTDNCDALPILTQNPIAGSAFTDGMTITITAKDVSNNSSICSFKVNTSADVSAPVITCIGDQTLSCGTIIPDYTPLVTANDNCDASPIITQTPAAGSAFTNGMAITITAKDASNNESYCTFKINVSADLITPQIVCIEDQNVSLGAVLPDYRSQITSTDNCDSNVTITQTPVAGTNVTNGMSVTMNVSDNSGNSASCSFKINVIQDTEAPVFACIEDQIFDCNVSTVPDYTKMIFATDNTDLNPVITQTPTPGSAFSDGMTITIKVSDKSNNSSSCSFLLYTNPILVDLGDDLQIKEGESTLLYALALQNGTFSWSPSTGLSNSKIGNPIAKPTETTTYKVIFTNEDGCQAEDFITITVIPTAKDETKYGFSPNGDGINDFWEIDGITDYPENEVLIYSRWGDLVFQTKGYDNATNVFSGIANKSRNLGASQLPEGTYFFEIRTEQPNHFKKTKGYLVLKR